MSPDKHPVFYLLNKLSEYQEALSSLHIHDDNYYEEQAREMLGKKIDLYFNKEKKAELKSQKAIIEERLKKEKKENDNINIQEETERQLAQYKKSFFEHEDNQNIKKNFE